MYYVTCNNFIGENLQGVTILLQIYSQLQHYCVFMSNSSVDVFRKAEDTYPSGVFGPCSQLLVEPEFTRLLLLLWVYDFGCFMFPFVCVCFPCLVFVHGFFWLPLKPCSLDYSFRLIYFFTIEDMWTVRYFHKIYNYQIKNKHKHKTFCERCILIKKRIAEIFLVKLNVRRELAMRLTCMRYLKVEPI